MCFEELMEFALNDSGRILLISFSSLQKPTAAVSLRATSGIYSEGLTFATFENGSKENIINSRLIKMRIKFCP